MSTEWVKERDYHWSYLWQFVVLWLYRDLVTADHSRLLVYLDYFLLRQYKLLHKLVATKWRLSYFQWYKPVSQSYYWNPLSSYKNNIKIKKILIWMFGLIWMLSTVSCHRDFLSWMYVTFCELNLMHFFLDYFLGNDAFLVFKLFFGF